MKPKRKLQSKVASLRAHSLSISPGKGSNFQAENVQGLTVVFLFRSLRAQFNNCSFLTANTAMGETLHQRQATSTWWFSHPFLHWGRSKWLVNSRGSHPRAILSRTTLLLVFCPCCPMRGHI